LQKCVEAGTTSSYNEDTEWEGKAADCIIPIKQGKLEIAAIKTWWMQFKDKTKYHILDNNCEPHASERFNDTKGLNIERHTCIRKL
jgi:hypothetical protein